MRAVETQDPSTRAPQAMDLSQTLSSTHEKGDGEHLCRSPTQGVTLCAGFRSHDRHETPRKVNTTLGCATAQTNCTFCSSAANAAS